MKTQNKETMMLFDGRNLAIVTKHQKEKIIGPRVTSKLGVLPFVPEIDTDLLGTFSGEIERELDPVSTARKKCEMARELTGFDLAISSEGSFGMHPSLIFITCNEEIVMLKDFKNDLEIVGRKISTDTNFDGRMCHSETEIFEFAQKSGFPEHGLIVRNDKNSNEIIIKGIANEADLKKAFYEVAEKYQKAYVETDMRSMHNPKRQLVIAEATDNLIERTLSSCGKCNTPGFGVTEVIRGLPCQLCGFPTKSVKSFIHSCQKCAHTEIRPDGNKAFEDPQFCEHCNP